jgi:hypothetical protein
VSIDLQTPKDEVLDAIQLFRSVSRGRAWLTHASIAEFVFAVLAAVFVRATFFECGRVFLSL